MVNTWNNIDRVSFVAREKRGRGERRRKSYRAKQDKMAKKLLKVLSANKRELRKLRLLRLKTDISNDPIRQGIQLVARLSDECDALRAKKEYLCKWRRPHLYFFLYKKYNNPLSNLQIHCMLEYMYTCTAKWIVVYHYTHYTCMVDCLQHRMLYICIVLVDSF